MSGSATPENTSDDTSGDLPGVGELLALVEQLDHDNERLRVKTLELMQLMEEAVTSQVAGERRIAELEGHVAALERELAAIADTRLMRMSRPLRHAYGRVRARWSGRPRRGTS